MPRKESWNEILGISFQLSFQWLSIWKIEIRLGKVIYTMEIGKCCQSEHFLFSESQVFSKLDMMGREMGCGFESHIDQNSDHYRAQLDPL